MLPAAQLCWMPASLLLAFLHSPGADQPLSPGRAIERELAPEETHVYRFDTTAGQSMHIEVKQQGIDVVVSLFSPDGNRLADFDSLDFHGESRTAS